MSVLGEYRSSLEYGAHIHGHLELVLVLEGSADVSVDFCDYSIHKGDVLLIFPNQIHDYHNDKVKKCIVFMFSAALCQEYQRLFERKVPNKPVASQVSTEVLDLFTHIVEKADAPHNEVDIFHKGLLHGYFLTLLSLLLPNMELVEQKMSDSTAIKKILTYCSQNYMLDISRDTLAADLHMNKFYISHLFNRKIRMGIRPYINMLRISEACQLLETSELAITEIAFQVGFNSLRSFNRAFLAQIGKTPSDYRAEQ